MECSIPSNLTTLWRAFIDSDGIEDQRDYNRKAQRDNNLLHSGTSLLKDISLNQPKRYLHQHQPYPEETYR